MYLRYFGLQEPPFSIAPNPRYLYLSERHQEALAHLIYGLRGEGGIVVLTGEVGTGKTTISRKILESIPESTDIAWIINPKLSVFELLANICDELRIPYPEGEASVKQFTDRINQALLKAHAAGRNTVLMIDEAQNLSPEVLEQLRLLTNLETNERKLLQIVLIGQDELQEVLARHDMRQLAQRVTARYHLTPLSQRETIAYIRHRLNIAGCARDLFKPSAMHEVYRLSRGVPRLINLICDRALLGAYAENRPMASRRHVRKAGREVLGHPSPSFTRSHLRPALLGSALILLLAFAFMQSGVITSRLGASAHNVDAGATRHASPNRSSAEGSNARDQQTGDPAAMPTSQAGSTDPWREIERLGDRHRAYQTLAGLWQAGIHLSAEQDPCEQLRRKRLQCLHRRGGWGWLRSFDRPAVLRLSVNGKDRYAVLTRLSDATATLRLEEHRWRIPLLELERRWFTDFTLLWQAPPGYQDTLRAGDQSPAASWISAQLDRIQGRLIPPHRSTSMDAVLVSRIQAFQRSQGLTPDGAAGPLTLMRINDAIGLPRPRLSSGKRD